MTMLLLERQDTAQAWFRRLRDDVCAEFERIEEEYAASEESRVTGGEPRAAEVSEAKDRRGPSKSSFVRTPWQRAEGGGGEISLMKGRVFEKVGVNISVVEGKFSEAFAKEIPGAADDPRFWASGISLVAHMASPKVPAVHMNTRMIATGGGRRLWFGGGADLNPMVPVEADTQDFHAAFRSACARTNASFYPAFRDWCDEYFFIPHRNEMRGVGGIFYDYLGLNHLGSDPAEIGPGQFGRGGVGKEKTEAGMRLAANADLDWDTGFAFTQDVGRAFLDIYPKIVRRHLNESWDAADRHHQLVKRGRYAEYNLLYDRGTRFGLMTGGNPEAILMSLPPVAIWE
jgi:coproporphyrinogen III oxidase